MGVRPSRPPNHAISPRGHFSIYYSDGVPATLLKELGQYLDSFQRLYYRIFSIWPYPYATGTVPSRVVTEVWLDDESKRGGGGATLVGKKSLLVFHAPNLVAFKKKYGADKAPVTCAHELFHALIYNYGWGTSTHNCPSADVLPVTWFNEGLAVWAGILVTRHVVIGTVIDSAFRNITQSFFRRTGSVANSYNAGVFWRFIQGFAKPGTPRSELENYGYDWAVPSYLSAFEGIQPTDDAGACKRPLDALEAFVKVATGDTNATAAELYNEYLLACAGPFWDLGGLGYDRGYELAIGEITAVNGDTIHAEDVTHYVRNELEPGTSVPVNSQKINLSSGRLYEFVLQGDCQGRTITIEVLTESLGPAGLVASSMLTYYDFSQPSNNDNDPDYYERVRSGTRDVALDSSATWTMTVGANQNKLVVAVSAQELWGTTASQTYTRFHMTVSMDQDE